MEHESDEPLNTDFCIAEGLPPQVPYVINNVTATEKAWFMAVRRVSEFSVCKSLGVEWRFYTGSIDGGLSLAFPCNKATRNLYSAFIVECREGIYPSVMPLDPKYQYCSNPGCLHGAPHIQI